MIGRLFGDRRRYGHLDLEAGEKSIRASMHQIGGVLLEKLLNADSGSYRGARIDCGGGHQARFVEYRWKQVVTVLAPLKLERAYYHCDECGSGVIPKDQELDLLGTSFSPGVRRMMGRVGAKEAFDEGRQDMEELAGIVVKTKEVERVSEAIGAQVEETYKRERKAIVSGKVVTMQSVPNLYVAVDGTCVPMVGRETEGRKGRDETGKAKTREAKVGCVFTQTRVDENGYPVRDEQSTSYVGAIEPTEAFGFRVYAEAMRRGAGRADRVIVLGDGAQWIWALADMHFPGAVQIVDLYHAREHLADVAKAVYGAGSQRASDWRAARTAQLDVRGVRGVLASLKRLRPRTSNAKEIVESAIDYFRGNANRMKYAQFRAEGLFVGSGVVEAACKAVIGQRLKQSGMRWTVRGANTIIALRCCQKSTRWEEFWANRATA
jgi:hypothetical protein